MTTIDLKSDARPRCADGKAPFDPATARYVHVLVRTDLSLAQQGVQACHAGMAAIHKFGGLTDDTRLALLAVDDEPALKRWIERLSLKGVRFEAFWEPDHAIGWSALATAPMTRQEGRVFKGLPVWSPRINETPGWVPSKIAPEWSRAEPTLGP